MKKPPPTIEPDKPADALRALPLCGPQDDDIEQALKGKLKHAKKLAYWRRARRHRDEPIKRRPAR
jgi:hypothetical protein